MTKKLYWLIFTILIILNSCTLEKQEPQVIYKLTSWQYSKDSTIWFTTYIPESLINSVRRDSLIYFPFLNASTRYYFIYNRKWYFRTEFSLPFELRKYNVKLKIDQIIGPSKIYLNGELIYQLNNPNNIVDLEIREKLKEKNTLLIAIDPIRQNHKFLPQASYLPSLFTDTTMNHLYVPLGITRSVNIVCWRNFIIKNAIFETKSINNDSSATIAGYYEIESQSTYNPFLEISIDKNILLHKKIKLSKGLNKIKVTFTIPNAKLWYPYTDGEPNVYKLTTNIYFNKKEEIITSDVNIFGIRMVEIDTINNKLTIKINNKPIKLSMVDYVPVNAEKINYNDYTLVFFNIKEAKINCLHYLGNSYIENPEFYEKATEQGILIINDIFTPSPKIADSSYIIKSNHNIFLTLSKHSSIIAINTNNLPKSTINSINENLPVKIPILNKLNFSNMYFLRNKFPGFFLHNTLVNSINYEYQYITSNVFKKFYKPPTSQKMVLSVFEKYPEIKDITAKIYYSNIYSYNECLDSLIQSLKKNYDHYNFGLLKDYTPIINANSLLEYTDDRKGKYYAVKKFNELIKYSVNTLGNTIKVKIIKTNTESLPCNIYFKLSNTSGKIIWRRIFKNQILENFLEYEFNLYNELNILGNDNAVMKIEIYSQEQLVSEYYYNFQQKEIDFTTKPQFKIKKFKTENGFIIEISSDKYCRYIYLTTKISGYFEKEYFEILPGESKKIGFYNQFTDIDLNNIKILEPSKLTEGCLYCM